MRKQEARESAKNKASAGKRQATGQSKAASKPPKSTTKSSHKLSTAKEEIKFPNKFPFWARLKIGKRRPTLVIDEEPVVNKKTKKIESGFVHREVTHTKGAGEEIKPNPDKNDPEPMYLKKATKLPKRLFRLFNKHWEIPEKLKERYEKNNHKDKEKK
jgi:hypothetical protein